MATRKRNSASQTCSNLVQLADIASQTGPTPPQATLDTYVHKEWEKDDAVRIIPFSSPFQQDNFSCWEEGKETQTSPLLGMSAKSTQTPSNKNVKKKPLLTALTECFLKENW